MHTFIGICLRSRYCPRLRLVIDFYTVLPISLKISKLDSSSSPCPNHHPCWNIAVCSFWLPRRLPSIYPLTLGQLAASVYNLDLNRRKARINFDKQFSTKDISDGLSGGLAPHSSVLVQLDITTGPIA